MGVQMLQIIAQKTFKTIPWKNGLGETTELAINDGGTLANFDWRLSIASVVSDGVFSDFSGYQRNLVLISGQGIMLKHDAKIADNLTNLLDVANFDGANKTYGELTEGPIKDFNIITDTKKISAQVGCHTNAEKVTVHLHEQCLYFAYSLTGEIIVNLADKQNITVPQGDLLKVSAIDNAESNGQLTFNLSGENMILIHLKQIEGVAI